MKNLDEKLVQLLTMKRVVKFINDLTSTNEEGVRENLELYQELAYCGFQSFSVKSCLQFANDTDTNVLIIGTIETINEQGELVSVPKIKKATNVGTKDKPDYRYRPIDFIKSFKYRYADKLQQYFEELAEAEAEYKAKKQAEKKASKKVETPEQKQKRVAAELEKEHKQQKRAEFKKQILKAASLDELKQVQTAIEAAKLQSPDIYSVIKSMRIKLQPTSASQELSTMKAADKKVAQ